MFGSALPVVSRGFPFLPRPDDHLIGRLGPNATFKLAIVVSLALHALVLAIHFEVPQMVRKQVADQLEIVLVNSKSARKPVDAQAKAQANLDGGGNTDENRRAKTPLPSLRQAKPGAEVVAAQRRVRELEAKQRKLLAQAKSAAAVAREDKVAEQQPEPAPQLSGADLAHNALTAIARMEAEIARNVEEYNKRPRRKTITARTLGVSYAWYFMQWAERIERYGALNYPPQAKQRPFTLMISVSVREDGSLEKAKIERSSGSKEVDRRALEIARRSAPFGRFTPEMRQEYQVFDIVSTWTFAPGGGMTAQFK